MPSAVMVRSERLRPALQMRASIWGKRWGDVFCGFADVVEAGEVEAGEVDVGVGLLSADLGDGVLAPLLVAGGEDDLVSLRGKLAGGGKTDAGVGAGDQGGGHESSGWGESAPVRSSKWSPWARV